MYSAKAGKSPDIFVCGFVYVKLGSVHSLSSSIRLEVLRLLSQARSQVVHVSFRKGMLVVVGGVVEPVVVG